MRYALSEEMREILNLAYQSPQHWELNARQHVLDRTRGVAWFFRLGTHRRAYGVVKRAPKARTSKGVWGHALPEKF